MTERTILDQALEALRPFAEFAAQVNAIGATDPMLNVPDDATVSVHINSQWGTFLKFEKYRRAAAAVEAIEKMKGA